MRKQIVALLAAFIITGIVALSMFVVGANAMVNPNSVPVSNSPVQAAAAAADPSTPQSAQQQITQLQSLIAQYQAREQQYQTALQNDNNMLQQASQELQGVQQLLLYLQQRGVIQIDNQGQIIVTGGSGQ
jgi:uncharacterized protein YlxW (UPF0749 family)